VFVRYTLRLTPVSPNKGAWDRTYTQQHWSACSIKYSVGNLKRWQHLGDVGANVSLLRGGNAQGVLYAATICNALSVPIWAPVSHSSFIHQSSQAITSRHLVTKQEKLGGRWTWILPTKYLFSYSLGSLTCRKILRNGTAGFTSFPKEVVLSLQALKNP
jgi:hypothetical protein